MKKIYPIILTLLVVFTCAPSAKAEAEYKKKVVAVEYFTNDRSVKTAYATAIRDRIISGISNMQRVDLIDVNSESALKLEESKRASESAMGDITARNGEMKRLGANYIITGNISSVVTEKVDSSDSYYYKASIVMNIKLINTENSTIQSSSYTLTGRSSTKSNSRETAILNAISGSGSNMTKFINEKFPLSAKIVELKDIKKDKLVSCYVNLGSVHGIKIDQYISIMKVLNVGGSDITEAIGQLRVREIVAPNMCLCTVAKGDKEVLKAWRDGKDLRLVTIYRAPSFF